MTRAIAIDMSRLWLAGLRGTPRGIERVDLALVGALVERWQGDLFGLSWTPWGLRLVERGVLARLVAHVEATWREQGSAEDDPVFLRLRDWIDGRAAFQPAARLSPARHRLGKVSRSVKALWSTGVSAGRPAGSLPERSLLASLGHVGLVTPGVSDFIDQRRDIRVAALIHDVISITDPQFFPHHNRAYFDRVFDLAMRRADMILTTTDTVGSQILALQEETGRGARPPVRSVDIGSVFRHLPAPEDDRVLGDAAYFLVCATREPRKNHMLLLNLWRQIAASGAPVPKLVLAGGHGWGSELVDGMLKRSPALRGHIAQTETLGSPGLFRLMGQARALLAPSFAEGYGLPVVEALSIGTPVLASAIPAFRETTRGHASLIDPLDGPSWRAEIQRRAGDPRQEPNTRQARAKSFLTSAIPHADIVAHLRELQQMR